MPTLIRASLRAALPVLIGLGCLVASARSGHAEEDTPAYHMRATTVLVVEGDKLRQIVEGQPRAPELRIESDAERLRQLLDFSRGDGADDPGMPWEIIALTPASEVPSSLGTKPGLPLRLTLPPLLPRRGRALNVGPPGAKESELIVDPSAKPIKVNDPGMIHFVLKDGLALAPGVYRFDMFVRLFMKSLKPEDHFDCVYPVEVYVPGRVIERVQFRNIGIRTADSSQSGLRVGDAASIDVSVLCIGENCEIGAGRLLLDHQSPDGNSKTLLKLPLPLTEPPRQSGSPTPATAPETKEAKAGRKSFGGKTVVVPFYDGRFPASIVTLQEEGRGQNSESPGRGDDDTDEEEQAKSHDEAGDGSPFWCHPVWREMPIWGDRSHRPAAPSAKSVSLSLGDWAQLHTVQVQLPDAFEPGEWKSRVAWNAWTVEDDGPAPPELFEVKSTATIQSGLIVAPRVCMQYEPRIRFRVVAEQDLGPNLKVNVTLPDGTLKEVTLERESIRSGSKHSGKTWVYNGTFKNPSALGAYSAVVAPTRPEDSLPASLLQATAFQVCFSVAMTEPLRPMVVFASPIPVDVWFAREWLNSRYAGKSWFETRQNAFGLAFHDGTLSGACVRRLPLFRLASKKRWQLVEPDNETEGDLFISTRPNQEAVDAFQSPAGAGQDPNWQERELTARKWLRWNVTAALMRDTSQTKSDDQLASPSIAQQRDIPGRRKQPRGNEYEQRLLLIGYDAKGEYYARVLRVPLKVECDDAWKHNKLLAGYGVILVTVLSVPVVLWLRRKWSRKRRLQVANVVSPTTRSEPVFFENETSAAAPATAPKAAPEPAPAPSPEENIEEWFSS